MWMEEHIGKRVNHERVEEALDTGASKIATGCPFCRVMMTDGVDDVAAANDLPKAEVLDVAQLLLGSLDMSSITLPEKGAAAKEAEERAATKAAEAPAEAEAATVEAEPEAKPEPKADAATAAESKPVTGLGLAGGAKRPGAKKTRHAGRADNSGPRRKSPQRQQRLQRDSAWPRVPSDQAQRRRPPRPPRRRRRHLQKRQAEAPAKPEPEVKGLGIAAGARRPGAKKAPAAAPAEAEDRRRPAEAQAEPPAEAPGRGTRQARTRGQGSRHRRGCTQARRQESHLPHPPPNPLRRSRNRNPTANPLLRLSLPARATAKRPDRPPVKGLGIAKGARPPGKR